MDFGYRRLGLAYLMQVDTPCSGNSAQGWLQSGLGEFLVGLSRLPHIDDVNATVLLEVGVHDPASWHIGIDAHLVRDSVKQLARDSNRENLLKDDGHDRLPSGAAHSMLGGEQLPRFSRPPPVATARLGHSSEVAPQ
jgi:hypothetical protein